MANNNIDIKDILENINKGIYKTYGELVNALSSFNTNLIEHRDNILYDPVNHSHTSMGRAQQENGFSMRMNRRESAYGIVVGISGDDIYIDVPSYNNKLIKSLSIFNKILQDQNLLKFYDDLIFDATQIGTYSGTQKAIKPGMVAKVSIPPNYPNHRYSNKSDAYIEELYSNNVISEESPKIKVDQAALSAQNSKVATMPSPTQAENWSNKDPNGGFITSGVQTPKISGIDVSINGEYHFGRIKTRNKVIQLVIHETVGFSKQSAIDQLKSTNYGIHLVIDKDGKFSQHNDIVADVVVQAAIANPESFGVEIVSPGVEKMWSKASKANKSVWKDLVKASWLNPETHGTKAVMPTKQQLESVTNLVRWAFSYKQNGVSVDQNFLNFNRETKEFYFKKLSPKEIVHKSGVLSHLIIPGSDHVDGAIATLYAFLRIVGGLGPDEAYNNSKLLTEKVSGGIVSVAEFVKSKVA